MSKTGFSGANDLFIPAEYREAALAAIVTLAHEQRQGQDYGHYFADIVAELRTATSLSEALRALGWEIREDTIGNMTGLVYATGSIWFAFASMPFLEAIAPYVRDGSFINLYSAYKTTCDVHRILFNHGYAEMRDEGDCDYFVAMLDHVRPNQIL